MALARGTGVSTRAHEGPPKAKARVVAGTRKEEASSLGSALPRLQILAQKFKEPRIPNLNLSFQIVPKVRLEHILWFAGFLTSKYIYSMRAFTYTLASDHKNVKRTFLE